MKLPPIISNFPTLLERKIIFPLDRKQFWKILRTTFVKWQTHNATLRAAALAFFTVLPLPSLLFILIGLYGLVYSQPQAIFRVVEQVNVVAGPAIAGMIQQLLAGADNPTSSLFSSTISIIFAVLGAIGAFTVLQDTLNVIWDVSPPKKRSIMTRIRERIVPFFLISSISAIVVAWTTIQTFLSNSLGFFLAPLIGNSAAIVLSATQVFLSFVLSVVLFSLVYAEIPDAHVAWGDVWLAAIISSFFSTLVNSVYGIYIHSFPVTSIAGAAGALIVLLIWIFVTDQFILFGAQFSNVYAETVGSKSKKQAVNKNQEKIENAVT
jgi:membrane protein